jgi:predicted PurR-regulated permease PerM
MSIRPLLLPISTAAVFALLWAAKPILVPLIIALLLAQLLVPIVARLERFMPRVVATIAALLLAAIVVAAVLTLLGNQLASLETSLPTITGRITKLIASTGKKALLYEGLEKSLGASGAAALSAVGFTLSTVATCALVVILTFLMLHYRRHFRKHLKSFDKRGRYPTVAIALERITEIGQSYVAGVGMVMALVGTADTLGLLLVHSPFAAVFGVLGGLSVLIPYVGIAVIAPSCAAIVWLTSGSSGLAGGVLAVFVVVHVLEGNVLSPYLVGSKVNLNPLATIVAVLLGDRIWGAPGMVLFIPLVSIAKLGLEALPGCEPFAALLGPVASQDSKEGPGSRLIGILRHHLRTRKQPA